MRKTAAPEKPAKKKRTSAGVLSRTPVSLRLFPDELATLKDCAAKDRRTDSAFARLCCLYGMAAYLSGKSLTA